MKPARPARTRGKPRAADAAVVPAEPDVALLTDQYFLRTKAAVGKFGDKTVTYAIFMRRPVICAPRIAVNWLEAVSRARGTRFLIELKQKEGEWVGAGDPIMYLTGSFYHLVDLETLYLQKIGPTCVAANNAYQMCVDLPKVAFIAMDARHCAGAEMAEMMAYAAAVGSAAARREVGAVGFIGNATTATARYFGRDQGLGTMPHALIGYAGSTVRAAEMYHTTFPKQDLTVLTDYFGREVSDALETCRRFPDLAGAGRLSIRLDTHGGRFMEGLDTARSYAVLERNAPQAIRGYRSEHELRHLMGTGVSAAAVWFLREQLDAAGFSKVRIVASSGFTPAKCKTMAAAQAPIDVIGTGSYLPEVWTETYATSDIIEYDGRSSVKVGREFLLRKK
jgi:nicotinate phosphoribosyltransferase